MVHYYRTFDAGSALRTQEYIMVNARTESDAKAQAPEEWRIIKRNHHDAIFRGLLEKRQIDWQPA